ncbi:MAG: ABC transporter permease [Candidatus Omnitrophota bacterium]|nr:ABC transporter permease [Candidatus Omnitrophota bacterium]
MLCEFWLSQRYLKPSKREKIISLTGLISVLGIAIGVAVLIVVIAVMTGFDKYLEDKMVGTNSHLVLRFFSAQKDPYKIADKLKGIAHILGVSPFVAGQAFMRIGSQVISLDLRGFDARLKEDVFKFKEYMKQGSLDVQENEVVLGEELAGRLGLRIGDKISLISPATLAKTDFLIKGLFNSGMYLYDSSLVMTSIKGAQDFFKLSDSVTGIAIKTDDIYQVDAVKENLYGKINDIGPYEVLTWVDQNKNFLNALKLEKIVMFIVVTMTTVVAAFGIASTLIMSVMSRFKDIGILRAVGAKTKNILEIFIFQGLSIGGLGIILGLGAGIALSLSLNNIVDFISQVIGRSLIPKDIYYFDRIPASINAGDITLIVVCALLISLAASIYPALKAASVNPAEALRQE